MNNIVIGQASAREHKKFAHFSMQHPLFDNVDLDRIVTIEYNPYELPRGNVWFSVENLSQKSCFLELLRHAQAASSTPKMSESVFRGLKWIAEFKNNGVYLMRITPSFYKHETSLHLSPLSHVEVSNTHLFVEKTPDAIYCPRRDVLFFRVLSAITPIFEGIELLYHEECSLDRVKCFLSSPLFRVERNFKFEDVPSLTRCRMVFVEKDVLELEDHSLSYVLWLFKRFDPKLQITERYVNISSNADLQSVIDSMEEDRYNQAFRSGFHMPDFD